MNFNFKSIGQYVPKYATVCVRCRCGQGCLHRVSAAGTRLINFQKMSGKNLGGGKSTGGKGKSHLVCCLHDFKLTFVIDSISAGVRHAFVCAPSYVRRNVISGEP